MKIVQIKMLKDFIDERNLTILYKDSTYFAIDGGDYWVVQRFVECMFYRVVPKDMRYALEVVPIHKDGESPDPGCCPEPPDCDCASCSQ